MTKSLYKLILSIFLVFAAVPVLAGTLWEKQKQECLLKKL